MSRQIPMAACLALLRAFDKDNPNPALSVTVAATSLDSILGANDLNDGQYAALVDYICAHTAETFAASDICRWVQGGNYTLPPTALALLGPRGLAERDVWNLGNSV